MIMRKPASLLALPALLILLVLPSVAQTSITSIQLTYKRDSRVVDSFRSIGQWAPGPSFGGAAAQDTVEVRAEGVDSAGRRMKINPQWVASNREMVTVEPSSGDDVTITVHRAGESNLKITYQGWTMELLVKAEYVNNFMMLEIGPSPAPLPNAPPAAQAPPGPKTKSDVSYAAGMNLAKALEEQSVQLNADVLTQGIKDSVSGGKTLMTEAEADAALQGLQTDDRIVRSNLNRNALGQRNKREGEAFLVENKKKEGVVTLPSGLQYKIIKAGEGKKPAANDIVNIQYRGTFIDGQEFDNTFGRKLVTVPVKAAIKGWTEALQLMPVGSKWQLFVPSDLAWGEHGAGGGRGGRRGGPQPQIVGPNATVIFELELISATEDPSSRTSVPTHNESNQSRAEGRQE